ncbi:MAG: hypothetical protein NT038_01100 [Euryarchaeota archaeon]|nr:hypothetical protein [Euryarchaeota archaeon]
MKGVTVILTKGYNGKSRLNLNHKYRVKLIDALTFDLYHTIIKNKTCNDSWDYIIATPDHRLSSKCKKKNISVLDLYPGELNLIFQQIQNWAVEKGYGALILCAGDVPLLQGIVIDDIKRKLFTIYMKKGKGMVICPSKKNGVSIIAMAPADLWRISCYERINNLQVIKGLNREIYPYEIFQDFRSYLDLDQYGDLSSALQYMEKHSMYENKSVRKVLHEILTSG